MNLWFVFTALCLAAAIAPVTADASAKRIAITFDDAPRSAGPLMGAEERTSLLIASLAKADIEGAMFFATSGHLEARGAEGADRLRRYAEAGHTIANHSHTHGSANRLSADAFIADVRLANDRLSAFPNFVSYFRFPFLDEGDTPAKRDAIRRGLDDLGLRQGYVTVDNYDWYLQALLDEAVRANRPLDLDAWRDTYVDLLMAAVRHYDALAVGALGRSPAHVLLLHENDLAALFIDDFAAALRADGWEVIPALAAYEDPIAASSPDTMILSQGRVAALASLAGHPTRLLGHPWESQAELRALGVTRGLVDFAQNAYLGQEPPGVMPAKFAPGIVSLADRYEYGTSLSADGRELFFGVAIEGRGEIRAMRFADGEWGAPEVVLSHPEYSFADPFLSRDRTRLYFISTRPAPAEDAGGDYNIWFVKRTRDGWSEPEYLAPPVNTAATEFFVSFTDEGTLVFASNRHEPDGTDYDIYLSRQSDRGFEEPEALSGDALTRAYEADPFVAPDGSYILFSSTRRSGEGRRDLYVTFRREDDSWSRAVSLGSRINTPAIEFCPFVTRDGRFLFYTSDEDIYWVDASVIDAARELLP